MVAKCLPLAIRRRVARVRKKCILMEFFQFLPGSEFDFRSRLFCAGVARGWEWLGCVAVLDELP